MTDHVWHMKVREAKSEFVLNFQTVRLPRQMRAPYPRDLQQLVEDWEQGAGFLVAEVDGVIRGYVDLIGQAWHAMACVVNLAVDEDYRRRGIGTELIRQARQWAWEQGFGALRGEATTKNYPALCFYRRLGFKFCGYNDQHYPNGDIALFFVQRFR